MADLDQLIIAFKKVFNKPHTSPSFTLLGNEALDVGFPSSSRSIISEELPDPSSYTTPYDTDPNYIIERVNLELEVIPNTGNHAFIAKLPSDYESPGNSNNPKAGTGNWVNGKALHETNGEIQIISTLLGGSNYQAKIIDTNSQEINPLNTDVNWILYEVGGVYYQEGIPTDLPDHIECWIYIGKMSDKIFVSEDDGQKNEVSLINFTGTGVSTNFDSGTGNLDVEISVSGSSGEIQDVFNEIALAEDGGSTAGDSGFVAESANEVLNLIAGDNITLEGNDINKSVTISSNFENSYVISGLVNENNLDLTLNDASVVSVDMSSLIAEDNDTYVISGLVNENNLDLTLNDASVVSVDMSSLIPNASEVSYNNSFSSLSSTTVQDALDELDLNISGSLNLSPGSITPETSFGGTSDNGTSDDYARSDHTHGTPAEPVTKINEITESEGDITGIVTLTAGTGVQLNQNGNEITFSADTISGAVQDVFDEIALAEDGGTITGDSGFVAENPNEVLNLIAGNNITLEGNSVNKSIIISSSGGVSVSEVPNRIIGINGFFGSLGQSKPNADIPYLGSRAFTNGGLYIYLEDNKINLNNGDSWTELEEITTENTIVHITETNYWKPEGHYKFNSGTWEQIYIIQAASEGSGVSEFWIEPVIGEYNLTEEKTIGPLTIGDRILHIGGSANSRSSWDAEITPVSPGKIYQYLGQDQQFSEVSSLRVGLCLYFKNDSVHYRCISANTNDSFEDRFIQLYPNGAYSIIADNQTSQNVILSDKINDYLQYSGGTGIDVTVTEDGGIVTTQTADKVEISLDANIEDLNNVSDTAFSENDFLEYTGTQWEPKAKESIETFDWTLLESSSFIKQTDSKFRLVKNTLEENQIIQIREGVPFKLISESVEYYCMTTNVNDDGTNLDITIVGPQVPSSVSDIYMGSVAMVMQVDIFKPGDLEEGSVTNNIKTVGRWRLPPAAFVWANIELYSGPSSSDITANVDIDDDFVEELIIPTGQVQISSNILMEDASNLLITRGGTYDFDIAINPIEVDPGTNFTGNLTFVLI